MKRIHLSILSILTILLVSCNTRQTPVTKPGEYDHYLTASVTKKDQLLKERAFWNQRITKDSTQLIDLNKSAQINTQLFQSTGQISYLKQAEQAFIKNTEKSAIGSDAHHLALAQNLITQHRFKEAQDQVTSAQVKGANKKALSYVQFDVAMELGNFAFAKATLDSFKNFSDYNYLIRLAKYEDYLGNLDATIQHMEAARAIADASNNSDLQLWTYTNLADYYGHDGQIENSYRGYLKALTIDPENAYAKKGLVWMAYAWDRNSNEALRILDSINSTHKSASYHLLRAEIAEFNGNETVKNEEIEAFLKETSHPDYGEMYNTHRAEILATERQEFEEALRLAQREVLQRPTPASYDLLAFIHYLKGDYEMALQLIEAHVIGKTHEPVAALHAAYIYKANGKLKEASELKETLLEAAYELGPLTINEVKKI